MIAAKATDAQNHTVEVTSSFSLEAIEQNQDFTVWSGDGQAELYLPAGALSANGQVSLNLSQSPTPIPEGNVLLSGPYSIKTTQGVESDG